MKTVLIFGRSTFINEVDVQALLNLGHTTIGINSFSQHYKTDYVAYLDRPIKCSSKVLTSNKRYDFTHDFAIEWCKNQGFDRIILVGCADFLPNHKHFDSLRVFSPSKKCIERSIKYIESICYNISTMNPKSRLSIPRTEALI